MRPLRWRRSWADSEEEDFTPPAQDSRSGRQSADTAARAPGGLSPRACQSVAWGLHSEAPASHGNETKWEGQSKPEPACRSASLARTGLRSHSGALPRRVPGIRNLCGPAASAHALLHRSGTTQWSCRRSPSVSKQGRVFAYQHPLHLVLVDVRGFGLATGIGRHGRVGVEADAGRFVGGLLRRRRGAAGQQDGTGECPRGNSDSTTLQLEDIVSMTPSYWLQPFGTIRHSGDLFGPISGQLAPAAGVDTDCERHGGGVGTLIPRGPWMSPSGRMPWGLRPRAPGPRRRECC